MNTTQPKSRRLQFGLRRLLLWTAVVAVWLSTLLTLHITLFFSVILSCWAIPVIVVRAAFGASVACHGGHFLCVLAPLRESFRAVLP